MQKMNPFEILKNGKPKAAVLPPQQKPTKGGFGSMKATLFSGPLGDVMEPIGEWKGATRGDGRSSGPGARK